MGTSDPMEPRGTDMLETEQSEGHYIDGPSNLESWGKKTPNIMYLIIWNVSDNLTQNS